MRSSFSTLKVGKHFDITFLCQKSAATGEVLGQIWKFQLSVVIC